MKAAVLTAPGRFMLREVARPEPGPGEVRVRLEGCGVCASNLAMWQGMPWSKYPTEPGSLGHEGWGLIDAIGHGVTELKEGDRVAILANHSYAEYDIANSSSVVPLPSCLAGVSFPGEAFGCALNIFDRSDIKNGQTVAIVGIGFLGAVLTRLAVKAGARVIAISRRPYALGIAKKMGAHELISLADSYRLVDHVQQLTGGMMCERVIEAVGKQETLDLAAQLTGTRAKLIIAGYHQDGPRQVNMQMWNWRGLDVINAHERDEAVYVQGIYKAVQAVESGLLNPGELCTHSFPLSSLDDALNAVLTRPDGLLKATVKYG
ncbi:MAG TPA: zinc-binding dehydrogenase [Candidatus Angelobacter sp.]|nr:zinc-binding dehydrogenase [Candidatus Angelobacter sp.]